MELSVVTTLYNSRRFLDDFLTQITAAIKQSGFTSYEIIFVNDGSPDDSLSFLISRQQSTPNLVIVDLSRNFGHHYAMQAGLSQAKGDLVFLIDNDLETPPSFLVDCHRALQQNPSIDVVYGYQKERSGSAGSLGGKFFWWMINKVSDVKIPKNILTERLMRRSYVDSLLTLGDANLFLGGMMYWAGYNQLGLPVEKGIRDGASTYSTKKRMALMVQAVTSFSGKPLEYLFYTGLLITFGSILAIVFLIAKKLFLGDAIELGWTSLVVLNVLILGILSTFLGLIGIYLFKIFRQVQNRPNAIIKKIYE